jgi:hypothetical protein
LEIPTIPMFYEKALGDSWTVEMMTNVHFTCFFMFLEGF